MHLGRQVKTATSKLKMRGCTDSHLVVVAGLVWGESALDELLHGLRVFHPLQDAHTGAHGHHSIAPRLKAGSAAGGSAAAGSAAAGSAVAEQQAVKLDTYLRERH